MLIFTLASSTPAVARDAHAHGVVDDASRRRGRVSTTFYPRGTGDELPRRGFWAVHCCWVELASRARPPTLGIWNAGVER